MPRAEPPADPVDVAFTDAVRTLRPRGVRPPRSGLTAGRALALFDAQAASRHLDLAARWLRAEGDGFYTIGSAGHESNAAVAMALRPTDPALLHYRSGGFYVARARQVAGQDPVRDVLLGLVGSAEEPVAGGRHKVFGHPGLAIVPQTSTVGSHLPRAVGTAFALDRARGLGVPAAWPADAIVVCSFGDASANHSTVAGAVNAAAWSAYQGMPLPLLLVCEDNGIGISVPTPPGWIARAYGDRADLPYHAATGSDPAGVYDATAQAAAWVRRHRRPAFLHLTTVRLMGHAGSDVETAYRTPAEIAADYAHDPLLGTARLLVGSGRLTPGDVLARYEDIREQVRREAQLARVRPRLETAAQVMRPLAPHRPDTVAAAAAHAGTARDEVFGGPLPEDEGPLTLAQSINRTLLDAAATHPGMLVFGEDVARKGGVYGVTRGLRRRLGPRRVFDTLLDEQTILGLALGAGLTGLLPVPEIQYLAYLHNAADQLRGEAATLQFFSQGAYRNPMVVRIAGYAYQKGFGGHFHNDNAVGALRDIPGLVIATPARPGDAPAMLRTCLAAAATDGRVCVFLEPIALYHTRDLYEPGDDRWLARYAPPDRWAADHVPIGRARTHGTGPDLTIITSGNGLRLSLRAARGLPARVVDLRWLAPLPVDDIVREARATGRVLVVDETRRTGGISEGVVTALADHGFTGPVARVAAEDSFVPLGDAANLVLVDESDIERAALELLDR
ncbi:MAG TPA: thiamine pyrophosphate-dependent enzyme [Actinophytocola sp.]|jgi:2-oxoisovalerate dehydrogenase E1 component|nr:thiamine pyrophosphate-dependent enzyme [Actinophytocola sp.]